MHVNVPTCISCLNLIGWRGVFRLINRGASVNGHRESIACDHYPSTIMIACKRCSLPCHRDRVECEIWFHYSCTDIPAYFILHLEEIKNIHYICEICVDRLRRVKDDRLD